MTPTDQTSIDALDLELDSIERAFRAAAQSYISTRRTRIAYFSRPGVAACFEVVGGGHASADRVYRGCSPSFGFTDPA
jgi:hypothetical protein